MKKYNIKIEQIDWVDKDGSEAEVLFELNGLKLWAFCHPCTFSELEQVDVQFAFIEEQISESTFWEENGDLSKKILPSENDRLRYYCYGQINEIHPTLVDCGAITFSFDDLLNDERAIGNFVYFVVGRLDIMRI